MDNSQKQIGWDGNNGRYYIYLLEAFQEKEMVFQIPFRSVDIKIIRFECDNLFQNNFFIGTAGALVVITG